MPIDPAMPIDPVMPLVPAVLLGLLAHGPMHGYDLKLAYDDMFGGRRALPPGQVYTTLRRLQRDGLITHVSVEPGNGPDRKTYALTDIGEKTFRHWIEDVEPADNLLDLRIHARTLLASAEISPITAHQVLRAQRAAHLTRMSELTKKRRTRNANSADQPGFAGSAIDDLELFHLEADIKWIEHRLEQLQQLQTPDSASSPTATVTQSPIKPGEVS